MKVLLVTLPLHGHVNPTLPVTERLVAAGHEVLYPLSDALAATVGAAGGRFHSTGDIDPMAVVTRTRGAVGLGDAWATILGYLADQLDGLPALERLARAEQPDLLVYDPSALTGQVLARRFDVPVATFSTSYVAGPGSALAGELTGVLVRHAPAIAASWLRLTAAARRVRLRYGVRLRVPGDLFAGDEQLNLVAVPELLQPGSGRFGDRWRFVGPTAPATGAATGGATGGGDLSGVLARLDTSAAGAGRPLAYVSLGSTPLNEQPDTLRSCVAALADGSRQVLVVTGATDPDRLGVLPPDVVAVPWAPQLAVLDRADVFVTHGGMNSTLEALVRGVPVVVVPFQPETRLTASSVARLGLGVRVAPRRLRPAAVREAVDVATGPAVRARLAAAQPQLLAGGGAAAAADALVTLAGRQ